MPGASGSIVFGQVSGANAPVAGLAVDKTSKEIIAVTQSPMTGGVVNGVVYIAPNGSSFRIYADLQGLITQVTFSDGSKITYTNYTASTVDLTYYDAAGNIINGPVTKTINASDITALKTAYAAIASPAYGAAINNPNIAAAVRWGALAVNAFGCGYAAAAAVATSGLAVPLAVLACSSALASAISTYNAAVGTNDARVNTMAVVLDGASCATGLGCIPLLADGLLANTGVPTSKILSPASGLIVSVNQPVHFKASNVSGYSSPIKGFMWDAGDGTVATVQSPTHFYTTPGPYTVTLTTLYMDGRSATDTIQIIVTPAAPTVVPPQKVQAPAAAAGNGRITISWNSSPSTGNDAPTGYNIYWSTSPGVTMASNKIAGVTSPYTHTGLVNGTSYYYRVTAVNSAGESALSAEVQGTPFAPSPPGTHWKVAYSIPGTAPGTFRKIVWTGSKFIAFANQPAPGVMLTSTNGATWHKQNLPSGFGAYDDVSWNGARYVAVGAGGAILTSPDGVNWAQQNSGTSDHLYNVVWSGQEFIALGLNGTILTSPDGIGWTLRTSGTTASLFDVARNGVQYVAVGSGGTILTSFGGITWTQQTSGTTAMLNSVVWSGSQYVAVGTGGTILTSPDGMNWTPRISGTAANLNGISWNGSQYVAVGGGGTILTSPDGIRWTARNFGTSGFESIAWSGTMFAVVGYRFVITSDAATTRYMFVMPRSVTMTQGQSQYIRPVRGTAEAYWSSNLTIARAGTVGQPFDLVTAVAPGTASVTARDPLGNTSSTTVHVVAPVTTPPVPLAGDPEFQLTWTWATNDQGPDIDLWVRDPYGNLLSSSRDGLGLGPTPEGGRIDMDDQGKFGPGTGGGPERAYWPAGKAPLGNYTYGVRYYKGSGTITYTLRVYKNGRLFAEKTGQLQGPGLKITLGTVAN